MERADVREDEHRLHQQGDDQPEEAAPLNSARTARIDAAVLAVSHR